MIAQIHKSANFGDILKYVLEKSDAELLETNTSSNSWQGMEEEFERCRQRRAGLTSYAVAHIILSLPASEPQSDRTYKEIAQAWLLEMEFDRSQYAIARHHDTEHEHIHIVANRIRPDGSAVEDSWDYRRGEVVCRKLERQFGLTPNTSSSTRTAQIVLLQEDIETEYDIKLKKSKRYYASEKTIALLQELTAKIEETAAKYQQFGTFLEELTRKGVTCYPCFDSNGHFNRRIAYEYGPVKVAGYKLGESYSFPGLVKHLGIDYDPVRDDRAIANFRSQTSVSPTTIESEPIVRAQVTHRDTIVLPDLEKQRQAKSSQTLDSCQEREI